MKAYRNLNLQYINGEWKESLNTTSKIDNINPYSEEKIHTIKGATKTEVDEAFSAAANASTTWSKTLPQERSEVLHRLTHSMQNRKDEIIDWLIKESGSTFTKATIEFDTCINIIKESSSFPLRSHGFIFNSGTPGKESRVYRKPLGVIGIISPWNFPLHLSMRSIAPAIALGNTVVIKPASQTPVTGATLLAKLLEEAELPKGVFNVVIGKGSDIGDYFVQHPIPKLISFTGSTPIGKNIGKLAGEALKRVSLELGGNNVFIVMKDANIDEAVAAAIFGKFMHQGQICMSINRLVIHEEIADEFVSKFTKKVNKLKVGDPSDKEVTIGPLINSDQVARIQKDIEASKKAGAKVLLGGNAKGALLEATILDHVTDDMPIAENEIFGPVAPIIRFKTEEEALKIANSKNFGLSGALHTKNIEKGTAFARNVETGMIHINDQTVNDEANAPFGGEKGSGLGRFNGDFVLEEFTRLQWVTLQHKKRNYSPFA
ncbi:aldehyde dehydrogenase family protein [Aquimarina sp. W85]|uniref:aldehyde dehydrogenase family protein n=1 Tax=Aquimarina rhodophyticola TaxID=3342246 RepID=UPI003670E69E